MTDDQPRAELSTEIWIRMGAALLILTACVAVLVPFVGIIGWAVVIAVALYPTYTRLARVLGDHRGYAATLSSLALLLVLIVPIAALSETLISGVGRLTDGLEQGTLRIPPPSPAVAEWPLVGKSLSQVWSEAAQNLEALVVEHRDTLQRGARWLVAQVASLGLGLLQMVVAVIASGFLLVYAEASGGAGLKVVRRLAGEQGERYAALAVATTRSVARGVLGVALLQAILAGLGFLVVGLPAAGLLAMVVMFLCIVQIGPALVLLPAAIYVASVESMLTTILFAAWCILVMLIDNVLKPMLLGRGVEVPMIIVVLGAIGGMISMGVLGLFAGAIVLVLGYSLLKVWVAEQS